MDLVPGTVIPDGRMVVEYGNYVTRHLGTPSEWKLAHIRSLVDFAFRAHQQEHPEHGLVEYEFFERVSRMGLHVYGWRALGLVDP
jgi:hypothetical protein